MKIVLQRVLEACVEVDGNIVGKIGKGLLVFLGISNTDDEKIIEKNVLKIKNLRIFEDENGKTNLSIEQVEGEILVVSQFTLYADTKKGNRPSFTNAGSPVEANRLYEYFIKSAKEKFAKVEKGIFGADMKVSLINDGPFTIILEEENL